MTKPGIDLILVNPNSRTEVYQVLAQEFSAIEPPVWAGLMASFVRTKGFSVAVVDADAEQLTVQQTADRISDMQPMLVAVAVYGHQPSASTQNMTAAGRTTTAIRQTTPSLSVLLVGGHVAALPGRTLEEEDADYTCGGEGLVTMVALLEQMRDGGIEPDKVPDLWYRKDGKVVRSPKLAPLVGDLDQQMPGIAWDLLPMNRYRAHNWHCLDGRVRQPYVALYTTLGCPYKCNFCCIQAPFKTGEQRLGLNASVNSYRFWSPKRVVDQLEHLVKQYNVRNVKFADEMFVLNPGHVLGICDELIERSLDLNIWAYARVDTVREEMVDQLKAAGFNWLAFGIEAASQRVRKEADKDFDDEDVFKTLDRVRRTGIHVIGNYIFGLPEDDRDTMQQTLELALQLNTEFANFYCAMAYPGSALFARALREGWLLPETWTGYSQHAVDTRPLPTKHLAASEVLRFRDDAFQTYYNSPNYRAMIEQKFGADSVQHICGMASHKLDRRYA